MTPAHLSAIRAVLGPLVSEAKCRAVFEAVLQSVRDDVSEIVLAAGRSALSVDDMDPTDDEVLDTFDAMLAALLYD